MTETGNIYKTIHAIQKAIQPIAKNGIGPSTQGSYKFVAVDDILSTVKPLLDEHGVIVIPTLLDHDYHYVQALAKDDGRVPREATTAWVKYEFKFVDISDGSSISSVVVSEGADNSDKATRKATTSAWKVALIQTFALITGEADPDAQDDKNAAPANAAPNPKIEGARPKAAAKGAPTPEIEAKRAELQKAAADLDRDFNNSVLILGDQKFGARGSWTNNVAQIDELIAAIRKGEFPVEPEGQ